MRPDDALSGLQAELDAVQKKVRNCYGELQRHLDRLAQLKDLIRAAELGPHKPPQVPPASGTSEGTHG